jgi:predicted RNA-binding Zn-ribbon protein involved in translation (DUF1610 family)
LSLFTISADGKSITCLTCRLTSYNMNDVAQRYCGNCKVFLDPFEKAHEFDCRECGRFIISLCDPYRRDICALCRSVPGWFRDPELARRRTERERNRKSPTHLKCVPPWHSRD